MVKKILLNVVVLTLLLCMLTPTLALADTTYTVQRGDTLAKIASKYGVTISELLSANPSIKNASLIYVGPEDHDTRHQDGDIYRPEGRYHVRHRQTGLRSAILSC